MIALCAGCLQLQAAGAAVVTPRVLVFFDGSVSGSDYLLGAGEIDATGTFSPSGSATVAGGLADIPGDVDASSGFWFDATALGSLTTSSWVTEAVLVTDSSAANQPGAFNHFLDVQGDLFYRFNGNGMPKETQYGFYDGVQEPIQSSPEPGVSEFSHVALTWDASTRTLEGFVNGQSQGALNTGRVFATPSSNVGYGFFARSGFFNRAIDGKLDAASFSTFTGEFVPGFGDGFDFQLGLDDGSPLALQLSVNSVSGIVSIANHTAMPVSINGYEIESEAGSLDLTPDAWSSLADQGVDAIGTASGESWQEGGSSSANLLLETFLLGGSTLEPGETLSLGRAFNEVLAEQDLQFRYRIPGQSGVLLGEVLYDDTPPELLPGDYNNSGHVDAADYTVWRDNLGSSVSLPNDDTAGVSMADYLVWRSNYGAALEESPISISVPSPSAFSTAAILLVMLLVVGKRVRPLVLTCALSALTLSTPARAQSPPAAYLRTPSESQLDWHGLEYYAFLHFGPNTFTDEEWGWSQSTPDIFNPTQLDTDQWAQSFRDAGMTAMILTAKHHDGMALWDTSTTEYKIGNGTWAQNRVSNGLDADVVRMAAESAKKYGLKFGVYLSPWDMNRDPAVAKPGLSGTIYEEPQIFGDANPGDYNDYYAAQLTELVTMELSDGSPVELFEVWLDGASGTSTSQTFDWTRYRDIIREHQPEAIMWGHQGVDARWVGNESGSTADTNWHTISRTQDQARYSGPQLEVGVRDGLYWTPSEADARLRSGWFYHENEDPKSASSLMQMYLNSVGRSVNLLLDVPPDASGQIVQEDIAALMDFKSQRDAFLDRSLIDAETTFTASSIRGGAEELFGPENVADGDDDTYWTMDDAQTTGFFEVDLGGPHLIDGFVVQEHIALGQRIGGYVIEAFVNGSYQTVVSGTSLGYQRIHSLGGLSVESSRIRFRVTQANATPLLSEIDILGQTLVGSTGDLNHDGFVNQSDWNIYIQWAGADLSSYTSEGAFARGDMNGDFQNNLTDFDLFATAYDKWNGEGTFTAMLSTTVPEPSALVALAVGVLAWTAVFPGIRCGGRGRA